MKYSKVDKGLSMSFFMVYKIKVLIFLLISFCSSEIKLEPIINFDYHLSGSDWVTQNQTIYSTGVGLKFKIHNNNINLVGSFLNNRFNGARFKSNLFNANKGIGWANSHELKGEKFDYDIANVSFFYNKNQVRFFFSTLNPKVDISYSSILISNKIPSLPHIGFKWIITPNNSYKYYHGRLKSEIIDSSGSDLDLAGFRKSEIESYFVFHQLTYEPFDFIELRFGEFVVYGNRGFELSYFPFLPFWSVQHFIGDLDNIQWNLITILKPTENIKLYNVFLVDEFRPGLAFKKNNRNWFAWQIGIINRNLFLEDEIKLEFSWADHRVYRHRFPYNEFYSNDYPIGFWAGPHSQEFLFNYKIDLKDFQLIINYSSATRGKVTNDMIKDQYATKYYERFSGILEKKEMITFSFEKSIFNSFLICFGINFINWENAGLNPRNEVDDLLNDIKKRSYFISLSNI